MQQSDTSLWERVVAGSSPARGYGCGSSAVEHVFSDCDFIVPFPKGRTVEAGCIELLIRPFGIADSFLSPCSIKSAYCSNQILHKYIGSNPIQNFSVQWSSKSDCVFIALLFFIFLKRRVLKCQSLTQQTRLRR